MSMQHVLTPHVALAPIVMVIVCLTGPALSRVIERRGFVEVFEASVSDTGVGVGVGVGEDGGEDELHMFRAMRTVRDGADDVEKIEERGGTLGGIWIGGIADGESIFDAFHAHEAVRLVERPGAIEDDAIASALQIGLGVGIVPMALERHNVAVDVVEIDADVLHLANAHFRDRGGSSPRRGHDYVEDGLEWMMRNCRRRMQGMKGLFGSGDERRAGVPYGTSRQRVRGLSQTRMATDVLLFCFFFADARSRQHSAGPYVSPFTSHDGAVTNILPLNIFCIDRERDPPTFAQTTSSMTFGTATFSPTMMVTHPLLPRRCTC